MVLILSEIINHRITNGFRDGYREVTIPVGKPNHHF